MRYAAKLKPERLDARPKSEVILKSHSKFWL